MRAVELGDDVGGTVGNLRQLRREVRDVQLARDVSGRVEGNPGVVIRVLPEVACVAIAPVRASRQPPAELPGSAQEILVDRARRQVVDEEFPGRRVDWHRGERYAVGIEVVVDERADEIAVPLRRPRQRARRGMDLA